MLWFKKKAKENIPLKVVAAGAFLVMVLCNTLANTVPINGVTTGEVSDSYPNLFAPIGFTFAIWGVIYLLLAAFCVYQFRALRDKKSRVTEEVLGAVLPYFIATSILNSAWIFAWHYRYVGLSVLLIIAILACLIKIALVLKDQKYFGKDYAFVRLPFSVYFGWITVAMIANSTAWLVSVNWNGWGLQDSFWTIAVLVIGALIAVVASDKNKDLAYLLVIVWAYFGILSKHLASSGFDGQYENIIAVLALLLGVFIYQAYSHIERIAATRR